VEKDRVQAFSDGVIAILITIMVLELRSPHRSGASTLRPLVPVFLTYVLSFVNLGIYWNNHHHLLMATRRVNGAVLWANLHLLFWLSLFPFFTGWMGNTHFAKLPTAAYGGVLLLAAIAYYILKTAIIAAQGADSTLATALGADTKGKISPVIYGVAIPLAFVSRWIAVGLYVVVSLMWLVPDRRIESRIDPA
jgi:TMEM175 potassium channel family protein